MQNPPPAKPPGRRRATPGYRLIAETLQRNIEAGNLPAGLVVNESALARVFGTSRIPAAAALRQLEDAGLIGKLTTRGFKVGPPDAPPLRLDLIEAGLTLPEGIEETMALRSHRARLYPHLEREIAACLPYGKFLVNESGLARAYDVSRTVAHEILVRLERMNIAHLSGSRWYVGPLTVDGFRERYEMRWLLEPVALLNAAPRLPDRTIRAARAKAAGFAGTSTRPRPELILELEQDLHIDMVLRGDNAEMRSAIYRCQLPLVSTHYTFQTGTSVEEIHLMLREHIEVFNHLLAGEHGDAASALERHLRSAFDVVRARYDQLSRTAWDPPAYMTRVR